MFPDSTVQKFEPNCYRIGSYLSVAAILSISLAWSGCSGISAGKSGTIISSTPIISLSPVTVSVASGAQQQFAALITNSSNTAVTWTVSQGSITQTGLFTAPSVSSASTVRVTATSVVNASTLAVANVDVSATANPAVSVSPVVVYLQPGGQQQFSAAVTNLSNTAVNWTASLGSISPSGLFTAPLVLSIHLISITATSVADPSVQAAVNVTVTPLQTLVIAPVTLPNATEGSAYSQTLSVSGGVLPYAWSAVSGIMPAGIQLGGSSGSISGTTGESGPFDFTVQVSDSSSPQQTASIPLAMTVQSAGVQRLPATFFGLHINRHYGPYHMPTIPFGAYRTIDSYGTLWNGIETSPGIYDFAALDIRLGDAQAAGVDVLYTIYSTPTFHSSNPTDTTCGEGAGACEPPRDINPDGSGTDANLIAFMTALVNHVGDKIAYYEVWNEANIGIEYNGTWPQLVRMAQDARRIVLAGNPEAKMLSPSFAEFTYASAATREAAYLNTSLNGSTGGQQADILNFHGYVVTPALPVPIPEYEVTNLTNLRAALTNAGDEADLAKPFWDSEWGPGIGLNEPDLNAAFIARHLLIDASLNIARSYYYDWDSNDQRALWSNTLTDCLNAGTPNADGYLCDTGTAFQQTERWLLGNTAVGPCSGPLPPATGVWTCSLLEANGVQTLAVWSTSQTCAAGTCTTSVYSYDPRYKQYFTLSNSESTPLSGGTVPVGAKPILLSQ
jgi:hypothetical protein